MTQNNVTDIGKATDLLRRVFVTQFTKLRTTSNTLKETFESKINKLNDKREANQLLINYQFSMDMLNNTIKQCEKVVMDVLHDFHESVAKTNQIALVLKSIINLSNDSQDTNYQMEVDADDQDEDALATELSLSVCMHFE